MYLQITTKCNMKCPHCCYSCSMRGKHGDYHTIIDAIAFARGWDDSISIGGGEPTLHPRFFDILKHCLEDFNYVWLASNGSQTDAMFRLANIIDGEDWPDEECDCIDLHGEEMFEEHGCLCHEKMDYGADRIYQEDKLGVDLSQDHFHDTIDNRIVELWNRRANQHQRSFFAIRNVGANPEGVAAQGRAKRTGSGWGDHCVCSDIVIKPDGKLRLCGCTRSPVVGDVWNGIESKWEEVIQENEGYQGTNCYRGISK